jgi:protein-S-isoprenylcysteine O-methyltransferase Ste14
VRHDSPGVWIPPPLIYLAFFLAGLFPRRFFPLRIPYGLEVGVAIVIFACLLLSWGAMTMLRARTSLIPHRPASALVAGGPFRYTRNPLYVGMIGVYVGAALWIETAPSIALLPLLIAVVQRWVIRREEAYLERRFGEEYRAYCRRVRRWL